MSKSNSFKRSRKLALGIAVAMGCSFATVAFADGAITADQQTVYNEAIKGHFQASGTDKYDQYYVDNGVFDKATDTYNFTDKNIQLNVKNNHVNASASANINAYAGVSAERDNKTIIDLHGGNLEINASADEKTYRSLGILATGSLTDKENGNVEIKNAGAITINASTSKGGIATGIDASGEVFIHNGGDNLESKILKINATKKGGKGGTGIDVNGYLGIGSTKVIIDGLVDIQNMTTAVNVDSGLFEAAGGKFSSLGQAFSVKGGNSTCEPIIRLNMVKDQSSNTIASGKNLVQIDGNIDMDNINGNVQVNIGLYGAEAYWNGSLIGGSVNKDLSADGLANGMNLFMDQGARWTGANRATNPMTLRMHNESVWEGGSHDINMPSEKSRAWCITLDTGSLWKTNGNPVGVKYFTGGKTEAERGYVDMTTVNETDSTIYKGDMVIDNYAGNTMFFYDRDSEYPTRVLGGNITIGSAAEGSAITLSTDNDGIDTSNAGEVSKVLNKLANKLTYTGAIDGAENNLDGYVQIAEGLTASSAALKLGDISFSVEDGKGSLKEGSIINPENKKNPEVIYGDKETAMMKGAKTAMASAALLWRAENNDLMKRMGDLRLSEGERGLWAKYYGGKYEMDSQNTDFNLKYNAYQLGYDADAGNGWTVGAAVSYNDGDATYGTGRGDLSAYSAGIYGTWKSEDGQYVDIIAKYSKLDNDYKVFNDSGHKLSGDYKTWGTSISAEYGKRFENDNGFYFDPSVELTLGRINGKDYNAHSDYLDSVGVKKDMQVEQDAFNTLVGRVGFRLGQKLDNASYFVKLAAAHEFSGDFDTTFRAVNEPEGRTSIDFGDTWYEAQIGGTAKLSKNSLIYADFERSFGGDVEEKWRVDAGLRFTF